MKFWKVDENMVFTEVKFPRDHAEGRRERGGIIPSSGINDDARYRRVVGRHDGVSVVVGGVFKIRWRHTMFGSW